MAVAKPSYTHEQTTAAAVWTAVHNLNTLQPAVNVWIPVNGVITAILPKEVRVIDSNTLQITFTNEQTGSVVIN